MEVCDVRCACGCERGGDEMISTQIVPGER